MVSVIMKNFYQSLILLLCTTGIWCFGYLPDIVGSETPSQCANVDPVALSINKFGFDLSKKLEDNEKNLFISPLSVYFALSLAYLGSAGQTAEQLKSALHMDEIGEDSSEIHQALQFLLQTIEADKSDYSFLLANGLFLQDGYPVKDSYINDAIDLYHAMIENVDFASNNVQVTDHINSWVANKTNNMIPTLFQTPLSAQTVMALLNVVYFKGMWEVQFDKDESIPGLFRQSNGQTKSVEYMIHFSQEFRYYEDYMKGYKYLELPYKGEHVVMFIVLPPERNRGYQLEMDAEKLCSARKFLFKTELMRIAIPKFSLKYREDLVDSLQQLGIVDLFDSTADLSLLLENGGQGFSTVLHEAAIDINEEGTEAAAATGMEMTMSLKPWFVANHPFSFYIMDIRNDLILFSGQVNYL